MDLASVLQWVEANGYYALFAALMLGIVGLPIPDETILVFVGALLARGKFNPLLMWLTAWCGAMSGISLSYFIGRTAGLGFIHKFGKYLHVTQERLDKVHVWYGKMGPWILVIGYYIAGVRHFSAMVAGTSGLSYPYFAVFAYAGAALWVSVFLGLGYLLGDNWEAAAHMAHEYLLYASIAIGSVVVLYFGIRWWLRRRAARAQG